MESTIPALRPKISTFFDGIITPKGAEGVMERLGITKEEANTLAEQIVAAISSTGDGDTGDIIEAVLTLAPTLQPKEVAFIMAKYVRVMINRSQNPLA